MVKKRSDEICKMWKKMALKDNLVVQKSKLDWVCNRDLNTKYFHNCMKERNRRNHLGPILVGEGLLEDVGDIKEEVRRFYHHLYAENDTNHPTLYGFPFNVLFREDGEFLEEPFTESKIIIYSGIII